jgi:NTP pyrophosphatase (non-canonical NTP hydrolase)
MLTFKQLQEEQRPWVLKNFGGGRPHHSLLGAMEELGELAHAHLKAEQGIRGSREEHLEKAKDAVADVIIYLADYCSEMEFDLQDIVESTWAEVKTRDWIADPIAGGSAVAAKGNYSEAAP